MMQKKFEKLPGLSNVSGKYTKKNSLESYPRTVVSLERKTSNTSSPSSSYSVSSSKRSTHSTEDNEVPHAFESIGTNMFPRVSAAASTGFVSKMRNIDSRLGDCTSIRPCNSISSPSWPSSLSSITSDRKPLSSNVPLKSSEALTRIRKSSEIVKSNSAGSVSNLVHKPTGIILATPSSPQNKICSGYRSAGSTENMIPNVPRPQGPSTPYPTRQTHRQLSFRNRETNENQDYQVARSSSSIQCALNPSSSSKPSFRPSVAVRPMTLPFHSKEPDSHCSFYQGMHANSLSGPPWVRCSTNNTESQILASSADSTQQSNSYHLTPVSHPGPFSGQNKYPSDVFSTSRPVTPSLINSATSRPNLQSSQQSDVISRNLQLDSMYSTTFSAVSEPTYESNFNCPAEPRNRGRFYGSQPRHASWSAVVPQEYWSSPISALPGPQYTQCALEQYLSDLLAEEYSSGPHNTITSRESRLQYDPEIYDNRSLPTMDDVSTTLEPLRFLEKRIENALRTVRGNDSNQHPLVASSGAQFDRSGTVGWPHVFDQSCANQSFQVRTRTVQPHERRTPEARDQSLNRVARMPSSMLEQFTEPELCYLLKAVQDLLILRGNKLKEALHCRLDSEKPIHTREADIKVSRPLIASESLSQLPCTNSRNSSRSSSSVRYTTVPACEEHLFTAGSIDSDHSSTDVMHKRLPLGFQHFKRYLDNKFGPDHGLRLSSSTRELITEPVDSTLTPQQIVETSNRSSSTTNQHFGRTRCTATPENENVTRMVTSCSAYAQETAPHSSAVMQPMERSNLTMPSDSSDSEDRVMEGSHRILGSPSFASFQEAMFAEQSSPVNPAIQALYTNVACPTNYDPAANMAGVQFTESHSQHDFHSPTEQPRHHPGVSPMYSLEAYHPFHQRSYCSTPDASELPHYPPTPCDPMRTCHTQGSAFWPSWYYWWPRLQEHNYSPHFLSCHSYMLQQAGNTIDHGPHGLCGCGPGHQTWRRAPCVGFSGSSVAPLRWNDRHYPPPSMDSNASSIPISATHDQTMDGSMSCLCGNPNCTQFIGIQDPSTMGDRTAAGSSYVCLGPTGFHQRPMHPFTGSSAYDSSMWCPPSGWNPRFPYYSTPLTPYHYRIPRSGSAGAGFSCTLESGATPSGHSAGNNNGASPGGLVHPRITRERSVGPELSGLQTTCVGCSTGHPCTGRPGVSGSIFGPQANVSLTEAPHLVVSPGSYAVSIRPMSNSLSANDLAGYRTKTHMEMRSTKSSFDLAPELPCDPTLALVDGTDFYSKIAAFIEMDSNLRLAMPTGWSERRSSFGRSYYACDSTRQASWHHPTLGAHVPLGWERVDSCQNGVYYQSLLIPHCQRHHPNLWLPAPLKDPAVEQESFFSDLRNLQSSLKHNVTVEIAELNKYKDDTSKDEENAFVEFFRQLNVETMIEVTRALDRLFYRELHALVVAFERKRLDIVSLMFTLQPLQHIFPPLEENTKLTGPIGAM